MEKKTSKTDVLVIGSSAAGLVAALTGKRVYPEKKFIVTAKKFKNPYSVWDPLYFWFSWQFR